MKHIPDCEWTTCQSIRTSVDPPVYPARPVSVSSCSSSPSIEPNENETGSPLTFQFHIGSLTSGATFMSAAEASNLCCRRWNEPAPTRTTARRDVTKERTERIWRTDSENQSLMAEEMAGGVPRGVRPKTEPLTKASSTTALGRRRRRRRRRGESQVSEMMAA